MSEATASDPAPDADPDYEQARDELASTVAALEAGGLSLEASLALWERGEALARVCERHLAGARERVESALERARSVGSPESVDGAHTAESMRDTREP